MKQFFMLTGESGMNIILIYSRHSSYFFIGISIGLSGNYPIAGYQVEVCTKDVVAAPSLVDRLY
jgi:hypothetical protein